MKMYKKSDLTIIDGMLVNGDGDIINVSYKVVNQANELETLVQKATFLAAQPKATPMPSLDGFVRTSSKEAQRFSAETPTMDAKAEEALTIMDELDDVATASQGNAMLDHFSDLIEFAKVDYVIDYGCGKLLTFDTPTLGCPLDLTPDDVMKAVAFVCGMTKDDEDEDDEPEVHVIKSIPLTKENLDKLSEFLDGFIDDDEKASDDSGDVEDDEE